MVKVLLYYRDGWLQGLVVEGHAGYGPHGQDIVCAAVSALAQTAVLAIERLAGVRPKARVHEGYLECFLPADLTGESRDKARLVLETAAVGLSEVARSHPKHVKVVRRQTPWPKADGGGTPDKN